MAGVITYFILGLLGGITISAISTSFGSGSENLRDPFQEHES
uniref:Photosystem II protein N n=1 Tax=Karenia mikimotoi TaxID=225107 RepID=A0A0U1WP31_KARMI|nr:photosystem II protein N [Karenia mikimotoi]AIG99453.1 photosystem II protein N [Karenia mikimotoi]AIG99454.1 photosystem II protein N [Karenia mikimotoi]